MSPFSAIAEGLVSVHIMYILYYKDPNIIYIVYYKGPDITYIGDQLSNLTDIQEEF